MVSSCFHFSLYFPPLFQLLSIIPGFVCHLFICFNMLPPNHLLYSYLSVMPYLQLISMSTDLHWPWSLLKGWPIISQGPQQWVETANTSLHSGMRDICAIVCPNTDFICMSDVIRKLLSSMKDTRAIVLTGLLPPPNQDFLSYKIQINMYIRILPELSSYSYWIKNQIYSNS